MTERMERIGLLGLLGVLLVVGLATVTEHEVEITVDVLVDGEPADALIKVYHGRQLVAVRYTDVHTPGRASLLLTERPYWLRVEHGAGYTALPRDVRVLADAEGPQHVEVELERAVDPRERGYYGADLHAHTIASAPSMWIDYRMRHHGSTPVDQAVGVQLAADLDVVFISDHNTAEGHAEFARTAEMRGVPYLLSDEVTTRNWGHFNLYGLPEGETAEFDFETRPSAYFAEARALDAEVVQVNHPYWPGIGFLALEGLPAYDPSYDALEALNGPFSAGDRRTIQRLFEFWSEGRRYVATAGSDDHDWRQLDLQYGTPRTYVHVDGDLTTAAFLRALDRGRAFVTYGPIVDFRAADGARPGATVELDDPRDAVELRAAIEGLPSLEGLTAQIVRNGHPIEGAALMGRRASIERTDRPDEDAWYAVRVLDGRGTYRALSNPIWVRVPRP